MRRVLVTEHYAVLNEPSTDAEEPHSPGRSPRADIAVDAQPSARRQHGSSTLRPRIVARHATRCLPKISVRLQVRKRIGSQNRYLRRVRRPRLHHPCCMLPSALYTSSSYWSRIWSSAPRATCSLALIPCAASESLSLRKSNNKS